MKETIYTNFLYLKGIVANENAPLAVTWRPLLGNIYPNSALKKIKTVIIVHLEKYNGILNKIEICICS